MTPNRLGRYDLKEKLGSGTAGEVRRANDTRLKRQVAIKIMRIPEESNLEAEKFEIAANIYARFQQEALTTGILNHPNIVTIHDYGEDDGWAYIVMEYLEGGTLSVELAPGAKPPFARSIQIMEHMLAGLQHSHERGIIHRDIKPANVMFSKAGATKIVDFGIGRTSVGSGTVIGDVLGTPSYMSPEQWEARGEIDCRCDIYAAGVVLYRLLTGRLPFVGDIANLMRAVLNDDPVPPSKVSRDAPSELDAVVLTAMNRLPGKRYQSASDFAHALRTAVNRVGTPVASNRGNLQKATRLLALTLACGIGGIAATAWDQYHHAMHESSIALENAALQRTLNQTVAAVAHANAEAQASKQAQAAAEQEAATAHAELARATSAERESERARASAEQEAATANAKLATQREEARKATAENPPPEQRLAPQGAQPIQNAQTAPAIPTAPPTSLATSTAPPPDSVINDGCVGCPDMIEIPAGQFARGIPDAETVSEGRATDNDARPVHDVAIVAPFLLGKYPVTRAQYRAFATANRRPMPPLPAGFPDGDIHPVTNVTWQDAEDFATWLHDATGKRYRLPSEAEWEYSARAGVRTANPWNGRADLQCTYANGNDQSATSFAPVKCDDHWRFTSPVGSFPPNRFGLFDMLGNVFQWTADCYVPGYEGVPHDGTAARGACNGSRSVRGGSFASPPHELRLGARRPLRPISREPDVGFRVARDLDK